jgi:hypothetical protein
MLTHARRPALPLLTLFVLAWLALGAAGCPPREATPDAQDAAAPPTQDAGAHTDAAPAPHDAATGHNNGNGGGKDPLALDAGPKGITHYEAAPGSKAVEDVGPPAPTLYFTAGLKGYTEPCGCTLDILLGGIDRIAGTLHEARAQALASLVLDAGDTLFDLPALEPYRVPQEKDKADVIVQALVEMGVSSTTPGPNDLALGAPLLPGQGPRRRDRDPRRQPQGGQRAPAGLPPPAPRPGRPQGRRPGPGPARPLRRDRGPHGQRPRPRRAGERQGPPTAGRAGHRRGLPRRPQAHQGAPARRPRDLLRGRWPRAPQHRPGGPRRGQLHPRSLRPGPLPGRAAPLPQRPPPRPAAGPTPTTPPAPRSSASRRA